MLLKFVVWTVNSYNWDSNVYLADTSTVYALLSVYSVQSTWNYILIFARGLCLCIYTTYILTFGLRASQQNCLRSRSSVGEFEGDLGLFDVHGRRRRLLRGGVRCLRCRRRRLVGRRWWRRRTLHGLHFRLLGAGSSEDQQDGAEQRQVGHGERCWVHWAGARQATVSLSTSADKIRVPRRAEADRQTDRQYRRTAPGEALLVQGSYLLLVQFPARLWNKLQNVQSHFWMFLSWRNHNKK